MCLLGELKKAEGCGRVQFDFAHELHSSDMTLRCVYISVYTMREGCDLSLSTENTYFCSSLRIISGLPFEMTNNYLVISSVFLLISLSLSPLPGCLVCL